MSDAERHDLETIFSSKYGVSDSRLLEDFVSELTIRNYSKGAILVREGKFESELMFLISGIARVFTDKNDDERTLAFIYETGKWIRVAPMLKEEKACASVEMAEAGEVATIPVSRLLALINKYPALLCIYIGELGKSVNELSEEKILLSKSNEEKYQWFLNKFPGLINKVEHYKIASYLHMSPVTMCRVRGRMSNYASGLLV